LTLQKTHPEEKKIPSRRKKKFFGKVLKKDREGFYRNSMEILDSSFSPLKNGPDNKI